MSDYPTIRPRLLLDFANSKKLDRRITFRRASTGTYVGVDGLIKTAGINEPRFDHDPVTGVCKGLLVEESKTNLLIWSFGRTLFTRTYTTVTSFTGSLVVGEVFTSSNLGTFRLIRYANNTAFFIAISGDQNLGNVPLTSASGSITGVSGGSSTYNTTLSDSAIINYSPIPVTSVLGNTIDISSGYWSFMSFTGYKTVGTACVCSIYVKIANPRVDRILLEQQGGGDGDTSRTYTFGTGTFSATTGSGSGTGVQGVTVLPNGWYRFYWGRSAMSGTNPQFILTAQNSSGATVSGGVYLDGGQIEETAVATSYIPTAGSTVTRSADLASITGTNFSSWYNQSESTYFIEHKSSVPGGRSIEVGRTSDSYYSVSVRPNSSTISFARINSGLQSVNTTYPTKIALVDNNLSLRGCVNGVFSGALTTGFSNITDNSLIIGNSMGFASSLNGTISRIAYWPKRLPDAQLQALTRR